MSTAGFSNIGVSFDWYCTSSGVGNLQVRYSLDGTTFQNLGSDYVATANDFYGGNSATTPNISVNLSGIAGAANDPNFAVEFVSVRPVAADSNFSFTNGDGNYASASLDTTTTPPNGDYNNNSGNWRFDNITVTGTSSAPEPASLGLLGMGTLALIARRRKA